MLETNSLWSAKSSSVHPKSTDPLEQTIRSGEEFPQLMDEPSPENAPAVLYHQLEQAPQQFVSRNEFDHLSSFVNSMDIRLTAGLTRVNNAVASNAWRLIGRAGKLDTQ
eukprot:gene13565-9711_t